MNNPTEKTDWWDSLGRKILGGFGNADLAVELFIQERDYGKAHPIIEEFRMSL